MSLIRNTRRLNEDTNYYIVDLQPNFLEQGNHLKDVISNNKPPSFIPFVHSECALTAITLYWKMPKSGSLKGIFFSIEKWPAPMRNKKKTPEHIEIFPVNGLFSHTFTDLAPGNTYRFRGRAINDFGYGPYCSWIERTTLKLLPIPPELHCVDVNSDSLMLYWKDCLIKGMTHYVVEMQNKMKIFRKIYDGSNPGFKLTALKSDTEYIFRIGAFDGKGQGPYSLPYTFTTSFQIPHFISVIKLISLWRYPERKYFAPELCPAENYYGCQIWPIFKHESKDALKDPTLQPSVPPRINIYSMIGSFYLSWTKPLSLCSEVKGYNIDFDGHLLFLDGNVNEVLLINLHPGTVYNIRIQAVNQFGKGNFSRYFQVTTLQNVPRPPELKCIGISKIHLDLVWKGENCNDVLSYGIEILGLDRFYTIYQGLARSCALLNLLPCTPYLFRTRTYSLAGRSEYSEPFVFQTSGSQKDKWRKKHGEVEVREEEFSKRNLRINFSYPPAPERDRVQLCYDDMRTLDVGRFINDNIIDFYMKYLYHEKLSEDLKEKTHMFTQFFFSRIDQPVRCPDDAPYSEFQKKRHDSVKTWTRKIDLFSKDFIVIPINTKQHWLVAIICFPGLVPEVQNYEQLNENGSIQNIEDQQRRDFPCLCIFDSYHSFSFTAVNINLIIMKLCGYLESEWSVKKGTVKLFNPYTMPAFYMKCPQQPNAYDCGAYMMQYVESFFENPAACLECPAQDFSGMFTMLKGVGKRLEIKKLILEMQEKYGKILVSITRDLVHFPEKKRKCN